VVFKYVKWSGIVVILVLLFLVVKAIFTGGSPSTPAVPRGPTITLVGVRPVNVIVARPSKDDPEQDGEIIWSGKLSAGESKVVARPGTIFITAEPPVNLDLDVNGTRRNLGGFLGPGETRGKLPGP
jgi:hypothetical protein